jgi:hypothetical protein
MLATQADTPGGYYLLNRIQNFLLYEYDLSVDKLLLNLTDAGIFDFIDNKSILIAKVFSMPLEEMPLLLNHVRKAITIIATWRLEIAK